MRRINSICIALVMIAAPLLAANWEGVSAKIKQSIRPMAMQTPDEFGVLRANSCTAFSINDLRDYFLTAAHCFGENMTIDGHEARLVLLDEASDLMVLTVPESGEVPEVKPARTRNCKDGTTGTTCQGQEVAALGYGFGVSTLKSGNVANSNVIIPEFGVKEHMLLNGFSYIPGMSGGPVFNLDGKIVGVIQWGDRNDYVGGGREMGEILQITGQYWGNKP